MDAWTQYEAAHNRDLRTVRLDREKHLLLTKLHNSLSYHTVMIDGVSQSVAITNTDNLDTKHIFSLPGEDLPHGGYVEWMDNHWLITERDANSEVYTKCVMLQCNYLLKWVDVDDVIHEQWCIVEDGTKLRRTRWVLNSLACWKRHVKTIPLIAGTPLELFHYNAVMKYGQA